MESKGRKKYYDQRDDALCRFLAIGMNKMRFFLLLLPIFAISPLMLASTPDVEELKSVFPKISTQAAKQLHETGTTFRYYYDSEPPLFQPKLSANSQAHLYRQALNDRPNISVEAIYFLPIEDLSPQSSANEIPDKTMLLRIYNTLRSISTLTGVEYYSESRGKNRVLFKSAYCVDSMENQNRIPDPMVSSIPPTSELIVFQEDLTFGKNLSRAIYRYSEGIISLSIINLTDMRYAFLPFIRKGNMQTQLILVPQKGGVLIYGNLSAKTLSFMGLERKKEASFYNRLAPLFSWLKSHINE